jgi:hypothetical protein
LDLGQGRDGGQGHFHAHEKKGVPNEEPVICIAYGLMASFL